MPILDFLTGSYEHRSPNVSSRRALNLYPELTEGQGKSQMVMIGTAGTNTKADFTNITTGLCRGLYYTSTGQLFAVYGGKIIEIKSTETQGKNDWVEIGDISDGSSRVSMTDDGTRLILADGDLMYEYNFNTFTLLQVSLPIEFTNPSDVVFIGQRVVAINGLDNKFWWSELFDGSMWDALSIAQAESSADAIIQMAVVQGELWLFGERSYEVRRVSTNPDNPYVLVAGTATEIGCGAKYSVSTIGGNVFWLGSSRAGQNVVYMSNGYSAQRISNHAIENLLDKNATTNDDAYSLTYQQQGHTFYYLSLVSSEKTFGFDLSTNLWHERSTREPLRNDYKRWDVNFCESAFNRVYCGAIRGSQLLVLDLNKYDEWDGRAIVRILQTPVYFDDYREIFHSDVEMDIESGVGLQIGQGSNPQIMMQYSDDGGHTWSSERWTKLGRIGQYRTRARWRRIGRSRDRVYRFYISDPIKVVMIGGRLIFETSANP